MHQWMNGWPKHPTYFWVATSSPSTLQCLFVEGPWICSAIWEAWKSKFTFSAQQRPVVISSTSAWRGIAMGTEQLNELYSGSRYLMPLWGALVSTTNISPDAMEMVLQSFLCLF
jgi:hypothetical protein